MKNSISLITVSIYFVTVALAGAATGKKSPKDTEKVMQVDRAAVYYIKTSPPQLKIEADGKTGTAGWTHPQLLPRVYVTPPADGMYEYDFVAVPPSGMASQVVTPISAHALLAHIPEGMKGVRVMAMRNSKEAKLPHPPRKD